MTQRNHAIAALTALALSITSCIATLAYTDAVNAELARMACRRTPDAVCVP
jgi:hypothetical protein